MNDLLIGLGSNEGNRLANLALAHRLLSRTVGLVQKESPIYETEPWGGVDQEDYYNQVLWVKTTLPLEEVFRKCQIFELKMGRQRGEKWGPRIIDIDVLYYNDVQLDTEKLTVPHPKMTTRRFVLQPLSDIAPNYVHPCLQQTTLELLATCTDPLSVHALQQA